jgi:hypothetical protein
MLYSGVWVYLVRLNLQVYCVGRCTLLGWGTGKPSRWQLTRVEWLSVLGAAGTGEDDSEYGGDAESAGQARLISVAVFWFCRWDHIDSH